MPLPKLSIDKKLIFTVTPGRSGTAYLAELFKQIPGISAHHEPDPSYAQVLRRIQSDPYISYPFLLQSKVPEILKHPEPVYVETSHLFCKGFLEPMLNMGVRPALIFLRRHPRKVAWSFLERSTIPGRTTTGFQHLLEPRDLNVAPFPNWQAASNYQLCFWYALEMERRVLAYTEMAKRFSLRQFDVTNEELNDFSLFLKMLNALDIEAPSSIALAHKTVSVVSHNANKAYHQMDSETFEQEEAVWDAVEHFSPGLRRIIDSRYGAL